MKNKHFQKRAAQNLAEQDQIWATIRHIHCARKIMCIKPKDKEFSTKELHLMLLCTKYVQQQLLRDCDDKIKEALK